MACKRVIKVGERVVKDLASKFCKCSRAQPTHRNAAASSYPPTASAGDNNGAGSSEKFPEKGS